MSDSTTHFLERSKTLSQTANEHSRAGAQACILINGGAATAVIAYLAKDKIDPAIVPDVTYSLAGYAVGVFAAAVMLLFATLCLERWTMSSSNPVRSLPMSGKVKARASQRL